MHASGSDASMYRPKLKQAFADCTMILLTFSISSVSRVLVNILKELSSDCFWKCDGNSEHRFVYDHLPFSLPLHIASSCLQPVYLLSCSFMFWKQALQKVSNYSWPLILNYHLYMCWDFHTIVSTAKHSNAHNRLNSSCDFLNHENHNPSI
jgi:hypothetical protein